MGDGKYRSKYQQKERELNLLVLAIHECGQSTIDKINEAMKTIIERNQ